MPIPKVKICGITRQEDATACVELGIEFCGFIFHPPSPRNIAPEAAANITTDGILRVGVFVHQTAREVLRIMQTAHLDLAQLAGDQDEDFCEKVGAGRIIRVFWPQRYGHVDDLATEFSHFADHAAYFLLDSGIKGGGSGTCLDFGALQTIAPTRPWFLAGGLGPTTIPLALECLSPFAMDLNSGVESEPGVKSRAKIEECLSIIRNHNHTS